MMKSSIVLAVALAGSFMASAVEPWRDPQVSEINRLPARTLFVPCETEDMAIAIANGKATCATSRYVKVLNGTWDFKWKANAGDAWAKEGTIRVPSCWQLQGEYDPPLYTNVKYPIGFDGAGDPTIEPPSKEYTSQKMRTPVALYTTTFKRPWRWYFRRTVLRFLGVSSAFQVRVNGKFVGYAEDSRLPSEFDVSPYLKWFGQNTIEVEVYKHSSGSYLEDQDFWRLSGIFRDVMLVSESTSAPKDLVAETWLADDFSAGKFTIRNEKGEALKVRDVSKPRLWSAEQPCVYMTPIEHKWGWWIFGGTDFYTVSFGFRKIEIRDSVIYLNGKRVLFKGVNRHEMNPETGYTLTVDDMKKDVKILHDFNVNAVRTCHYPDDPAWYDLCDREGLMVVCEANVEAHGVPQYYTVEGKEHLPKNPRFHDAIVRRNTRMARVYRNHPSILIWSLGNESGFGPALADAYKALKQFDPTRLVQYSMQNLEAEYTDIHAPMYKKPADCEAYLKNAPKKPLVLCEYAHAMGNSNGDVFKYWDLVRKYPSFQGGFVWDFADQALWQKTANGRRLAYGGDFGDKPNDGNFNCNGMFDALRRPHPGAFEVKHCYQSAHVISYDWKTGAAVLKNEFLFNDLIDYSLLIVREKNGVVVEKKWMDFDDFLPGTTRTISVDPQDSDTITFRFKDGMEDAAWDQFAKPFRPVAAPIAKKPADASRFRVNLWRAPTDNDRGWRMAETCRVWKVATETQKMPAGVTSALDVGTTATGETIVDWTLTVPQGLPPLPRAGLSFTIPKEENREVKWYGLGPWENYSDRARGALLGIHTAKIGLCTGEKNALNADNYIEPGEQGYRTGCRWLKVGAVEVTALNRPFGFNAWPYPQTMLEGKAHVEEMRETDAITVNIDVAQMGVGGDDSWGARPHDEFMLSAGTYHLVFKVKGL